MGEHQRRKTPGAASANGCLCSCGVSENNIRPGGCKQCAWRRGYLSSAPGSGSRLEGGRKPDGDGASAVRSSAVLPGAKQCDGTDRSGCAVRYCGEDAAKMGADWRDRRTSDPRHRPTVRRSPAAGTDLPSLRRAPDPDNPAPRRLSSGAGIARPGAGAPVTRAGTWRDRIGRAYIGPGDTGAGFAGNSMCAVEILPRVVTGRGGLGTSGCLSQPAKPPSAVKRSRQRKPLLGRREN